jgi:hypothetical protein
MMRHMMMGGYGHHMMGGLGMMMMHRMLHRVTMYIIMGALVALVVMLWLRRRAPRQDFW